MVGLTALAVGEALVTENVRVGYVLLAQVDVENDALLAVVGAGEHGDYLMDESTVNPVAAVSASLVGVADLADHLAGVGVFDIAVMMMGDGFGVVTVVGNPPGVGIAPFASRAVHRLQFAAVTVDDVILGEGRIGAAAVGELPEHLQSVPRRGRSPRQRSQNRPQGTISRQTVRNILRGETWIDLPTLYCIEQNLNVRLWTSDHWSLPERR